ncbi:hypothetical protein L7F22_003078 [Adiantum nelumboides]|nr:hypothetical protein [Adiantum nelumboides]
MTSEDSLQGSSIKGQGSTNDSPATSIPQEGSESTLTSRAPTPVLPELTLPEKVKEAIERKSADAFKTQFSPITSSDSISQERESKSRHRATSSAVSASQYAVIIGIALIDFDHAEGPRVEYAHPKEVAEDEELRTNLPFLALPDGSHARESDFCYFHVLSKTLSPSTVFGISCNRQIASDSLNVRGAEVTRSTVQKAVVVLARDPVFGPIKEKLGIVTQALFAQKDFTNVDILIEFHATLEAGLRSAHALPQSLPQTPQDGKDGAIDAQLFVQKYREEERKEREATMYMGTSLRELIYKWRFKTLMLVKLLLLQRKVMFFGYPVERLCTYQYSLISLIPDLLFNLADAGSPALDTQTSKRKRAESLKTSDRQSLMRFMGFPLHLFGEGSFFQPYLPLQQLEMAAKSKSYLVGTTNSIFRMQKECAIDVIVDLEQSNIEFLDPTLHNVVALTPADRKWMDDIVHLVLDTWNPDDPTRPISMQFQGSDDHLRAKFEEYITALLASVKYSDYLAAHRSDPDPIIASDRPTSESFGVEFVHALKQTRCFELWNRTTDQMIFDLFEKKHPCEGKTSTLEDVSLRLTSGIYDMHLDEKLALPKETREMVSNALNEGGKTAWKYANKWGSDLARFRREQIARAQQANNGNIASNSGSVGVKKSVDDADATIHAPDQGIHHVNSAPEDASKGNGGFLTPAQQQAALDLQKQASAAAAQAGTQMRAALSGFGSFLSARQKAWSAGTTTTESNVKTGASSDEIRDASNKPPPPPPQSTATSSS